MFRLLKANQFLPPGKVCWLALVLVGIPNSAAFAHRLDVDSRTRPLQKVRIESYFSDDSRPKGATIQVFELGAEEPFLEDHLNDQGEFEFLADARPLRVVISAGEGHRKEVVINPALTDASTPMLPIQHQTALPITEGLVGIGFLLAAAAFVMSLRNARQLREMRRETAFQGAEIKQQGTTGASRS